MGNSRGFICILLDTTESHKAQEAISELNKNLEREIVEKTAINEDLESFSYSVSHDLRSPIRAIDGFSRLLEDKYSDRIEDEGRRYLGIVREHSRKMGQLIDDLLSFSRLGRKPITGHEVEMQQLVQEEVLQEAGVEPSSDKVEVKFGDLPNAYRKYCFIKTSMGESCYQMLLNFPEKNPHPAVEIRGYKEGNENIYSALKIMV